MIKKTKKLNILDVVVKILDSELPTGTKNAIVTHYLLPRPGNIISPVEKTEDKIETVDRPSAEDIEIENNPRLKAEYKDTERLMTGKTEEEDEDDN